MKLDIVCFDTQILIWGFEGRSGSQQTQMVPRAQYLVEKCVADKTKVIVPALVLSELLAPTPIEKRDDFVRRMQENFIIVPYDGRAAAQFAKMWTSWKQLRQDPEMGEFRREELKVDYMIVATAIANKAWCIYTGDPHIKRFAGDYIRVAELPDLPPQQGRLL